MLTCPTCQSTDHIEIVAEVFVALIQDEDGIQTEPSTVNGDHQWDDHSSATCRNCDWLGSVADLGVVA